MMEFFEKIGLPSAVRRRIALVMQGTTSGPGININQLGFSKDIDKKEREIKEFISVINLHFEGVLQVVKSGDFLVPIITNRDAIEVKRRAIPSKVIALACIILLHEFVNGQGPTLTNLETKFQVTDIRSSELRQLLRELKDLRWLEEVEEAGVTYFNPSTVLKACISPEMLQAIYSELYVESGNIDEKEILVEFFPKEYMKVRRNLRMKRKQHSLKEFTNPREEELNG